MEHNRFIWNKLNASFHKYIISHEYSLVRHVLLSRWSWTIPYAQTQYIAFRLLWCLFHQQYQGIFLFIHRCSSRQTQYTSFTHWSTSFHHVVLFYMVVFTPYLHIIVCSLIEKKTNGLKTISLSFETHKTYF